MALAPDSINQFLDEPSAIFEYIERHHFEYVPPPEGHATKVKLLKIATVIFTGALQSFYSSVDWDAAERFHPLTPVLYTTTMIAYWVFGSWPFIKLIDDFTEPLTDNEIILIKSELTRDGRKILLISSFVVGTIVQIPAAAIAYFFNHRKLWRFVVAAVAGSPIPTLSLVRTHEAAQTLKRQTSYERRLQAFKDTMIPLVERNLDLLAQLDQVNKTELVATFRKIKSITHSRTRRQCYAALMLKDNAVVTKQPPKAARRFVALIGVDLTLSHMTLFGILSYRGAQLLISSPVGCAILTGTIFASTLYLESKAIGGRAVRAFDSAYNLFTGNYVPPLSAQFRPKLSFAIKALGLITACLAFPPAVELSDDFVDDPGWKHYFQITDSLAMVLFVSTAILDIIDGVIESHLLNRGKEEERDVLELKNEMKSFIRLIKKSPMIEFARFLRILPEKIWMEFVQDAEVTEASLDQYIKDHTPSEDPESQRLLK